MKKIILALLMTFSIQAHANEEIPYKNLLGMLVSGMPGYSDISEVYFRDHGRNILYDPYETNSQFRKAYNQRFDEPASLQTIGFHNDMIDMINIFGDVQKNFEQLRPEFGYQNVNLWDNTAVPRRVSPLPFSGTSI